MPQQVQGLDILNANDPRVQEILRSDPDGYHMAVFDRAKENNKNLVTGMVNQGTTFLSKYAEGINAALNLLSEELMIFRRIESHVRNNTGNEQLMNALFDELYQFRERSRKLGQQMAEKAKS